MTKTMALAIIGGLIFICFYLRYRQKYSYYKIFTRLCTGLVFSVLLVIVAFVIINGISYFKPSMLSLNYHSTNLSMGPAIVTTIITVVLAIAVVSPIAVGTAIFLVEYTEVETVFVQIIRLGIETLAGIPSIVYGLFGMLFFVTKLKLGYSLLAGVMTVSMMILPIIIRATEEGLKSVPASLREGSYALGAGKLRTVFRVVLPLAMPGILSGVILAIGRIVGETAALMYTLGTEPSIPTSLKSSSRTLALHMYMLSTEGTHVGEAYATAMVLLLLVLIINHSSNALVNRLMRR